MLQNIVLLGGIVLGIVYFVILNKLLRITYWGFKGILATIGGCCIAGIYTLSLLLGQ